MIKAWRNSKEIKIIQVPSIPEDAQRLERLISLLSTGVERLITEQTQNNPSVPVDFQPDVLVNTCNPKEPTKSENK